MENEFGEVVYPPVLKAFEPSTSAGQNITPTPLSSVLSQPHSFNPIQLESITTENEPIEWIWEGFLARGHKTLLSALWKSGKSTLVATLLKALQNSDPFCNKPTAFTKVFIISEESKAAWARRREEFELNSENFIWVMPRQVLTKMSHKDWTAFLKKAADFCKENEIRLVIIDTLSAFWPISDENNATDVQAALMPLNQLLVENIGVLLIHHHRKGGGDQGQAARGSGALGSDVDIIIDFERLAGDPGSSQRKLTCLSRFEETPAEMVMEYVGGTYNSMGSVLDVAKEQKLKIILTILGELKTNASTDQVLTAWDTDEFGKKPSKRSILRWLQELVKQARVAHSPSVIPNIADTYSLHESRVTGQTQVYNDGTSYPYDTPDQTHKLSVLSHEATIKDLPDEASLSSLPGLEGYGKS